MYHGLPVTNKKSNVPVSSYVIDTYCKNNLVLLNYIDTDEEITANQLVSVLFNQLKINLSVPPSSSIAAIRESKRKGRYPIGVVIRAVVDFLEMHYYEPGSVIMDPMWKFSIDSHLPIKPVISH